MNKVWSKEEKEFIKNNASMMKDKTLAIKLVISFDQTLWPSKFGCPLYINPSSS